MVVEFFSRVVGRGQLVSGGEALEEDGGYSIMIVLKLLYFDTLICHKSFNCPVVTNLFYSRFIVDYNGEFRR